MSNRYRLAYTLVGLFLLGVLGFWSWEFRQTILDLEQRSERLIEEHQRRLLENKAEDFRDLFVDIYQSARTISLLPMVRDAPGGNRKSAAEDVVDQGRFSLDAHRTMQQVYANLRSSFQVSEIYMVLDGFEPGVNVPFFMYDDQIVRGGLAKGELALFDDAPVELEDEEYRELVGQLSWFRQHAPAFLWIDRLGDIPVRMSPIIRTCDNTQYLSVRHGNVADSHGIVYAMPVYDLFSNGFKGIIAVIMRANALEARLLGVPFLPITTADLALQRKQGWQMPPPSPFRLEQPAYGIDIRDRRNPSWTGKGTALAAGGKLASISIDLSTGQPWQLSHMLTGEEVAAIVAPLDQVRRQAIIGRVVLLVLLLGTMAGAMVMLRRARQELITLAHYDTLTALPNRQFFFNHLRVAMSRAKRHKHRVALIFLDIPDFKAINDTHGHKQADHLLAELADRLRDTLRDTDLVERSAPMTLRWQTSVCRLGGDEFIVICEDMRSPDDITPLIQRLLDTVKQPFPIGRDEVEIKPSIGVAFYPDDASECDKLLVCAGSAMHEGRRQGGAYFVFNEALRQRSERQHLLSVELHMALQRGQFELFYQPKADLRDGRVVSLEALLRWRHPELGMISPVEFIPILERNGDIIEVGAWVIEASCHALRELAEAGFDDLRISANVSVRQLKRPDFPKVVADLLDRTNTTPDRLILEITESVMMDSMDDGSEMLNRLKAVGTPLAIDDFGTGYSSLTYLQYLPIDYLKLDKAFIDGMTNPKAVQIVETVIRLANGLDLKTIAEGIETVEQRDTLASLGCDIMQGYLLSKPRPLAEIIEWMRQR